MKMDIVDVLTLPMQHFIRYVLLLKVPFIHQYTATSLVPLCYCCRYYDDNVHFSSDQFSLMVFLYFVLSYCVDVVRFFSYGWDYRIHSSFCVFSNTICTHAIVGFASKTSTVNTLPWRWTCPHQRSDWTHGASKRCIECQNGWERRPS